MFSSRLRLGFVVVGLGALSLVVGLSRALAEGGGGACYLTMEQAAPGWVQGDERGNPPETAWVDTGVSTCRGTCPPTWNPPHYNCYNPQCLSVKTGEMDVNGTLCEVFECQCKYHCRCLADNVWEYRYQSDATCRAVKAMNKATGAFVVQVCNGPPCASGTCRKIPDPEITNYTVDYEFPDGTVVPNTPARRMRCCS